jgi:putative ABC transport system ATP-binding protein
MKVITLRDVTKIYRLGKTDFKALDGISLEIRKGEFISIMGPSGSGKSTLLHIMGCLDRPTSGEVYVLGKDVRKLSDNELANLRNRKIGFVFQLYYLLPNLTALENVEVPMIFAGLPKEKRVKRAMQLLKLVGVDDVYDHKPVELSGGQRQRVAIARALANDPEIILADEPTGALDIESAEVVMNIFKKLNKEGKTVVIITHDPKVAAYAERIVVIKGGKIVADGVNIDEATEILKK